MEHNDNPLYERAVYEDADLPEWAERLHAVEFIEVQEVASDLRSRVENIVRSMPFKCSRLVDVQDDAAQKAIDLMVATVNAKLYEHTIGTLPITNLQAVVEDGAEVGQYYAEWALEPMIGAKGFDEGRFSEQLLAALTRGVEKYKFAWGSYFGSTGDPLISLAVAERSGNAGLNLFGKENKTKPGTMRTENWHKVTYFLQALQEILRSGPIQRKLFYSALNIDPSDFMSWQRHDKQKHKKPPKNRKAARMIETYIGPSDGPRRFLKDFPGFNLKIALSSE